MIAKLKFILDSIRGKSNTEIVLTEIEKGEVFYFAKKPHLLFGRRPYTIKSGILRLANSTDKIVRVDSFNSQGIYNVDCWEFSTGVFALEFWERYPCFDSYDYEYDDRYYRLFMLCNSLKEAEKKLKYRIELAEKQQQQKRGDGWRKNNDPISRLSVYPREEELYYCAPCVYYDDNNYVNTYSFYEKIK